MRLWSFDRLGSITSEQFDINEDGLRFVSAVIGFLRMSDEQLGFDPAIVTAGHKRFINIVRNNRTEQPQRASSHRQADCMSSFCGWLGNNLLASPLGIRP